MELDVVSVFDGISCGMVSLERAGITVGRYVAFEIEPNAIKISKKNYPQIEHCGDVTTADFTQYEGFDLLIGGSPCQSLSIVQSKTRQHLDGKSKLFFEFVRAKEEMKPTWFLFENVASMNEESKQAISELLGCEPIFIDSGDFSAQERPRYYWTNIPVNHNYIPSSATLKDILVSPEDVPQKYWYNFPIENIDMNKQVCGTLIHSNHEMHKRIFNPEFKCHTLTCVSGGNQQKKVLQNGKARKLMPIEYERLQTLPDNYTEGIADGHRYTCCGNGWTVDVIAHIFTYIKRKEDKMELKIKDIVIPEVINFNFEEIKQEITAKAELYSNMVYTEETIKEAKADKAKLNKFITALEDKRKEIKKQCLAPYESFEKQMKELVAIVNEPVKLIDSQVKNYDEKKKEEKLEKIKEFWESTEHPEWLQCNRIFDQRWLNATFSMKKVQEAITERLEQIKADLATLEALPEFSFEAVECYADTLDINKAIHEGQRLADIQKRKMEAEAQKKADEEKLQEIAKEVQATGTASAAEVIEAAEALAKQMPPKQWVKFEALLSVEDATALKQFFEDRKIEFKAI